MGKTITGKKLTNHQKQIHILLNHIHASAELIRSDALILQKIRLAEFFRIIVAESTEIKRLSFEITKHLSTEIEPSFLQVVREEIARHLYIIKTVLVQLPLQIPPDDYTQFQEGIESIHVTLNEVIQYFEQLLSISNEPIDPVPIQKVYEELKKPKYFPLDFVPYHESKGFDADKTAILCGQLSTGTEVVFQELDNLGFSIITVLPNENIFDILPLHDVNILCFDCDTVLHDAEVFLSAIKKTSMFADIPVLICGSSFTEEYTARFIELGAFDYFSPQNSTAILKARIQNASLITKNSFHQQLYIRSLELEKNTTTKEYAMAASYVRALLPQPFSAKNMSVDWEFLPSLELGGDIFGYSWISNTEFVIYLIDVSGHGLEASLYSVTIMNLLKNRLFRFADFSNPASILDELNSIFKIEEQNNMFFTAWFGIYDCEKRVLTYSSAGLQPAVLYPPESNAEKLITNGIVIGVDNESKYENKIRFIAPGSRLYIFSDGIYELKKADGTMFSLNEFIGFLGARNKGSNENCHQFIRRIEKISKTNHFDDDVSLIEICFFD